MQINNNYATRQPKFGALKSIQTTGLFDSTKYLEQKINVMRAFKESEGLTELCKKYDVNAIFSAQDARKAGAYMLDPIATLQLGIRKLNSKANSECVNIKLNGCANYRLNRFAKVNSAFDELVKNIKDTTFFKLEQDYLSQKNVNKIMKKRNNTLQKEYNDIVDSLLKD